MLKAIAHIRFMISIPVRQWALELPMLSGGWSENGAQARQT
jgi:hypothetical protein